jgi:Tfp pilus assembly protein PilF
VAGLTSWALGSLFYDTGYASYYNPYYDNTTTVIVESPAVDYSQPIQTAEAATEEGDPTDAQTAAFDQALDSFYAGDYRKALEQTETALAGNSVDTSLHEFRALVLFALKDYKGAAAALYGVLSVAPGWDWTTMSSLYPSVDVYTHQLRALEAYTREHAKAADAHFVLAYHYLTAGHAEAAAEQLKQVVALTPNDQVSRQLLAMITPEEEAAQPPAAATPDEAAEAPESVVGNWKASSGGDGSVQLTLNEDGAFTWKFTQGTKSQEFGGKYQLAGSTLVLEYDNGNTMVGKVAAAQDGFHFRIVGGPPSDPGLAFQKAT